LGNVLSRLATGFSGSVTFGQDAAKISYVRRPSRKASALSKTSSMNWPVASSEDGAHVAYMAERGGQQFVGRDGIEDEAFEALSRSVAPTFGGGGRHLAYGAHLAGGDFRLILDGVPVGSGSLAPNAAVFSSDGERLAYVELRGKDRREAACRIVLDGHPGD